MDTETDEVILEVDGTLEPVTVQKQEGPDYSRNLPKNKLVPESQIQKLKIARRMIGILSHFSSEVKVPGHTYNIYGPVELPERYIFWETAIRFLPFWWSYEVLVWDDSMNMRIPQSSEEFEQDMIFISAFSAEYKKTNNGTRRKLVTITKSELVNRDKYTSGTDFFEYIMKRTRENPTL
jgi:hypothetical protein